MPPFDDVADWLDTIDLTPSTAWKPVPVKDLDPDVRAHSAGWCRNHLSEECFPYAKDRSTVLDAAASAEGTATTPVLIDLLRHRYDVDGSPVELIEGRNFTLIRMGSGKARGEEIHRLARRLLSQPWTFQLPESIEEGVRFSSAPDVRPETMASWNKRADGGIRGGKLWFLCFRRVPQLVGFPSDMQWFPDAFRARLRM